MPFVKFIQHYKGSAGSGDWSHRGRPGNVGGSGGGGGLRTLGVSSDSSVEDRKQAAKKDKKPKTDKEPEKKPIENKTFEDCNTTDCLSSLDDHYDLTKKCPQLPTACMGMEQYSGDGAYESLNSALRKGESLGGAQKNLASAMDEEIDKLPRVPQNMNVYRGVYKGREVFGSMEPGDTFSDKSYVSTTATRKIADGFSNDFVMKIQVKKGSKGAFIKEISEYSEENELLLPRGSKFRVVSKAEVGTKTEMTVELL